MVTPKGVVFRHFGLKQHLSELPQLLLELPQLPILNSVAILMLTYTSAQLIVHYSLQEN